MRGIGVFRVAEVVASHGGVSEWRAQIGVVGVKDGVEAGPYLGGGRILRLQIKLKLVCSLVEVIPSPH